MKNALQIFLTASFLVLVPLVAVVCGQSLSGKYTGQDMTIEFKDGGKATVTVMNSPIDATDTIDGNKVTLTATSGGTPPLTFTINSDGTLTAPDGSILKKQ